jgi:predicted nucleic acid-binding protein
VPPEWPAAIRRDQLLTSPVVKLELLHSTRNAAEFEVWDARLAVLRAIDLTATIANAAVGALRELAPISNGYHRVGLGDALIAASAQDAGVGVLHYNPTDFDRLNEVMHFDSVLLAPVGTFEH